MKKFVPLSIPNFEGNEKKYVDEAIEQGWVSTGGAFIKKFEEQLASYLHLHSVVACQSGTAAIHLSLVSCGIMPGDMVIVPALTFIATVNPVKYQFAEPVFIDCDSSLCIDPLKFASFCEKECEMKGGKLVHKASGKHVKAVIVVHVFGNMADMESVMKTATRYNLMVIEDATEALGTYYTEGVYKGMYAGTIGDYGAYSFNGNKIITTGGGGAVTAKKQDTTSYLRYLSTQAKDDPLYYIHNEVGYNYRMTNLQAALGAAQMEELPKFIKRKHSNYLLYKKLFEGYRYAKLLGFRKGTYSNQWFYSLEIQDGMLDGTIRDIITKLGEKGVQTRTVWELIPKQRPYQDAVCYKIEKAVYYSRRILNIPSSTQITEEDIHYCTGMVKEILEELADA